MFLTWLSNNYIEIIGAITGLIYLYFSVNRIIWLWPFGIATSLIYTWVFFDSRLYADMSLQVYYFFISIYGWYFWLRGGGKYDEKKGLDINTLNRKTFYIVILLIIILTLISGYVLREYTNSSLPYWDAFTTSASILATWMLARKILENWLFWIVIDFISMGMYIYKGLYPTVGLFFVYTIIAYVGYLKWKKA